MNLFIIPSWFPSEQYPSTGIFFKEQAQIIARKYPEWKVGVSTWGSHEPSLWIRLVKPLDTLIKLTSRFPIRAHEKLLEANCVLFFTPAHTWSRRFLKGNINRIIKANEENLKRYITHFGKPDLMQADISFPAGYIAASLSKKYKIPFFIKEQMSPFPLPSFKSDYHKWLIPPLDQADAVLAVGNNLIKELAEKDVKADLTINFIDLDFFQLSAPEKREVINVFALGRMVPQKGFDHLIKALGGIKDRNWQLRIGGSGPMLKSLKKLSRKYKIKQKVSFLGELDQNQVVDEMQNCDFFVLSSRHESFGVVLLEAMACGKPVLVTRCGGITDQLPDQVSIQCDPSAGSLKEGLLKMFEVYSHFDSTKIRTFVETHYSVDQAVAQLEEIKSRF